MWAKELSNLADAIDESGRVKSGRQIEPAMISARLRVIAEGVELLEAARIADHARVVPADVRRRVFGENVIALAQEMGGRS